MIAPTLDRWLAPAAFPAPALSRWSVTWRYALASVPLAAVLVAYVSWPAQQTFPNYPLWRLVIDPVLGAAGLVAIRWRRRWPVQVSVGLALAGVFAVSVAWTLAWAYISLCTRRSWRQVAIAASAIAVTSISGIWLPWGPAPDLETVALLTGVLALTLMAWTMFGFYLGARRDLAASLVFRAESAERARELAVLQERARIAREMHDVLAHRISLVAMHAGVLAYRDDLPVAQVKSSAEVIRDNAHLALTELRGVLTMLRGDDGQPVTPQPTLADLDELIDTERGAGGRIELADLTGGTQSLPSSVGRHAYRIVQEALTNARKHAPGSRVEVRLWGRAGERLELSVKNPVNNRGGDVPGARMGLVGLAERAQIAGGHLNAGEANGIFEVHAWLPWMA